MKAAILLQLIGVLGTLIVANEEYRPTVSCSQGTLKGLHQETISGKRIKAFLGIPYALPPVGELRFKEPVDSTPWTGVLNAWIPSNICMQYHNGTSAEKSKGSEDCLYLNIYTPEGTSNVELHDVVVYIHGGGYQTGSANYHGPDYLLDQVDVVLVTLNYRLGVLGFLSLQDEVIPGNMGLKDQTMALKWIKANIQVFGGDPNKITITGCSSGGASVHSHILSRLSRGLFQKAVIASGVALNPWAFIKDAKSKAIRVAAALGCPTDDSKLIAKCLRERPAERITATAELFKGKLEWNDGVPISPVVENPSPTAFIDKDPQLIIQSGEANDVPLLLTLNNDEALYISAEILSSKTMLLEMEENWNQRLMHMNYYKVEGEVRDRIAHQIRKFYLGDKKILESPARFTQMFSDWAFVVGIEKAAKLHAEFNKSPVYSYVLSFRGKKRYSDLYNTTGIYEGGACHGDDLYYVIRTDYLIKRDGDKREDAMSRTMIDVWMQFIKGPISVEWKPVKDGLPHFTYLNVTGPDEKLNSIETDDNAAVNEFWESIDGYAAGRQFQHKEL